MSEQKRSVLVDRYSQLWAVPGARSLLLASMMARGVNLPIGALITVTAYQASQSWTVAAIAGGATAGGSAISAWIAGRWMDRVGMRRVLWLFLPFSLAPLLFLLDWSDIELIAVALFVGLVRSPVGTAIRTSWQYLLPQGPLQKTAYGLDSASAPIAGALGAAIGGALFALIGAEAVVGLIIIGSILPTLVLVRHSGVSTKGTRSDGDLPKLGSESWLLIALSACSWAALGGVEIAIGVELSASLLLFANALSFIALVGGAMLYVGQERSDLHSLSTGALLIALALPLCSAALLLTPYLLLLSLPLLGVGRGLITSAGAARLAEVSPADRRAEALALWGSGVLAGQAVYRPLSGLLLAVSPIILPLLPALPFAVYCARRKNAS